MYNEKRIIKELNKIKEAKQSDNSRANVLEFYKNNKEKLEIAYKYWKDYEANQDDYFSEFHENIDKVETKNSYLLLTVNNIEEEVLLHWLKDINGQRLETYFINGRIYHVCKIEDKSITLIHTKADKTGDEYVRRAINETVRDWGKESINYIYMLGVCYGIDMNKDTLCTVIVSNEVHGYRINFRDEDGSDKITLEPEIEFSEKPNSRYIDGLSHFFRYYRLSNPIIKDETNVHFGKYISANCLISCKKVKNTIMSIIGNVKPKPIGGEMEACGIYKSTLYNPTPYSKWLIIKGICDWGESKNLYPDNNTLNDYIKDSIQALAMLNTCSFFDLMINKNILYVEE